MTPSAIKAPNQSENDIRQKAELFLNNYNSNNSIPVPIEDIIEIDLKINIVSLLELQNILPIDGFITNDFKSIYVDKGMYDNNGQRYLFTLAHEIGHMFLHEKLYNSLTIDSMKDYLNYLKNMSSGQYNKIEYQANLFAEFILVPSIPLEDSFNASVSMLKKDNFDLRKEYNRGMATKFIARSLQNEFKVSDGTILNRINQDKLIL